VAPSLIPVKPRRASEGESTRCEEARGDVARRTLTEVHPPTPEEESVRDLCRCRDDIREDLIRSRHRCFCAVDGSIGKAWNDQHRQWLRNLALEHDADRAVFDDYLRAMEHLEERLCAIEIKIATTSHREPYREPAPSLSFSVAAIIRHSPVWRVPASSSSPSVRFARSESLAGGGYCIDSLVCAHTRSPRDQFGCR
jgi:transposase